MTARKRRRRTRSGELLEEPLERDREQFEALYDVHATAAFDVAYAVVRERAQAQDVVQDVFLRLWRRPELFDPARGDIATLVRVMARTRAVDLWRQAETARRGRERLESLAGPGECRPEERPAAAAERAGDHALLIEALRGLPHEQREALVLAYWAGLTVDEIARRAGIPIGTAKSRVRLGLTKLRAGRELLAG